MRLISVLTTISLGAAAWCHLPGHFSPSERAAVLAYWKASDRYTCALPSDYRRQGIWQVRLTVSASQWLWDYQGGKKNPLINARPPGERAKVWDSWIQAKVAHDRWEALESARDANELLCGIRLPISDKQTPTVEPPEPGPIPSDLLARSGMAPRFAEAVMPLEHRIKFDDLCIVNCDNPRLSNPRYAYYRSEGGVLAGGSAVKKLSDDRLNTLCTIAGLTPVEAKVMKAVSMMEGGFDSVNTYDTGFVSVGFIQFASRAAGGNALGAMLKTYKQTFPADFQSDFERYGIDVSPEGLLLALDLRTGDELIGPDANQAIIADKRLAAVFQHAGLTSDRYNAMQLKAARDMFLPMQDKISVKVGDRTITGVVSDFIKSEAGMAILMDRKVNTGKIDPLPSIVKSLANELNIQNLCDLAPYERDIVGGAKYRKDFLADGSLVQPAPSPRAAPKR
jgi:hypothetical protein